MAFDKTRAQVALHYTDQWSVFSGYDFYQEHRLYWSAERDKAALFASAHTRWTRAGCPNDGSRPLSVNNDGSIHRQRDFDHSWREAA